MASGKSKGGPEAAFVMRGNRIVGRLDVLDEGDAQRVGGAGATERHARRDH